MKILCDDCIHKDICCAEGMGDPALTFCANHKGELTMKKNQIDKITYTDIVLAIHGINMIVSEADLKKIKPYMDRIEKDLLTLDVYDSDNNDEVV